MSMRSEKLFESHYHRDVPINYYCTRRASRRPTTRVQTRVGGSLRTCSSMCLQQSGKSTQAAAHKLVLEQQNAAPRNSMTSGFVRFRVLSTVHKG